MLLMVIYINPLNRSLNVMLLITATPHGYNFSSGWIVLSCWHGHHKASITVNGNCYVTSFVNYHTRLSIISPSGSSHFPWITKQVRTLWGCWVICRHGVPEAMISDHGDNLLSTINQEVCEETGMWGDRYAEVEYHSLSVTPKVMG